MHLPTVASLPTGHRDHPTPFVRKGAREKSNKSTTDVPCTCPAEVLAWVAEGKTNVEIGTVLGARPRTVAKHLERIYQKLGVENRTAAAAFALNPPKPPAKQ